MEKIAFNIYLDARLVENYKKVCKAKGIKFYFPLENMMRDFIKESKGIEEKESCKSLDN